MCGYMTDVIPPKKKCRIRQPLAVCPVGIEECYVRQLLKILGRSNPHIDTVLKVKNLILNQRCTETILQGVLKLLMFRFEIKAETSYEAMFFITSIIQSKEVNTLVPRMDNHKKKLLIKKTLDHNVMLIKQMLKEKMSYVKIYNSFNFDFSLDAMAKYLFTNKAKFTS
jgi:hypothetical protein